MSRGNSQTVSIDYKPRAWQAECHKRRQRFTVLALHRRAGKTELAIMELLDHAITCRQELGFFVYIAPFLKQAKAIAWARLKQNRRAELARDIDAALEVVDRGPAQPFERRPHPVPLLRNHSCAPEYPCSLTRITTRSAYARQPPAR